MRAAIVIACILGASPAFAQGIGREIMEKMSGPEPSGLEVRFPLFCNWEQASENEPGAIWYWQTSQLAERRDRGDSQRRYCVDLGYWSFSNSDREDEAFHVSGQRLEATFTWRLDRYRPELRAIQPGVSVGAIGFLTDEHREWRPDVSFRLLFRPLDLVPQLREHRHRWGSVVQISLRLEWILGGISYDELGANPADPFDHTFRVGGSWRQRPFIILDFSEMVGLR